MITTGSFTVTDNMRERIKRVLDSGRVSYGDESREFERRFSALHDCDYGVLSNSGTSSLHVALQTLKEIGQWPDYSEVIIPATTFVATCNIVLHNKLTPVPVDAEPVTFGIDPSSLLKAITLRTRCVIPVHIGGQPCNMTDIMDVVDTHALGSIEDSCEAMFATHDGHPVGSMSDIGCFSMYVAHLLVAGVGGIAITHHRGWAAKMRSLVNHGLTLDNLNLDENMQPQPMLNRRFVFDAIGHSFRITEFEAALANSQLDDYKAMVYRRQTNASSLTYLLQGLQDEIDLPTVHLGNTVVPMFYVIQTKNEPKDSLCRYLNTQGIETRDLPSLLYQPCYSWNADDYPVSKRLATHAFYISCSPHLTQDNLEYMATQLHKYFEHVKAHEHATV